MASQRRGPWSSQEDNLLIQLVQTHGALNWVRIAQTLGTRTPKQCRERFHQNLKPSLNHEPITPEEGAVIEQLVAEIGKRWAEIARRLHGRSDNAVKNWWNGSQNRRRRLLRRRAAARPSPLSSQSFATSGVCLANTRDRAQTHAFLDDDSCSRLRNLPYRTAGFPLPRPGTSSRSPTIDSHSLHRHSFWTEASLPSPCSSEPAESDTSSNYTTSPAGASHGLHQAQLALAPLRSWYPNTNINGAATLPSLSSLTPGSSHVMSRPRSSQTSSLPFIQPEASRTQLLTAPSSPSQIQRRASDAGIKAKDSRMNLTSLLD